MGTSTRTNTIGCSPMLRVPQGPHDFGAAELAKPARRRRRGPSAPPRPGRSRPAEVRRRRRIVTASAPRANPFHFNSAGAPPTPSALPETLSNTPPPARGKILNFGFVSDVVLRISNLGDATKWLQVATEGPTQRPGLLPEVEAAYAAVSSILAACRRVPQVGWPRTRLPSAIPILAACRRVLQANWPCAILA